MGLEMGDVCGGRKEGTLGLLFISAISDWKCCGNDRILRGGGVKSLNSCPRVLRVCISSFVELRWKRCKNSVNFCLYIVRWTSEAYIYL